VFEQRRRIRAANPTCPDLPRLAPTCPDLPLVARTCSTGAAPQRAGNVRLNARCSAQFIIIFVLGLAFLTGHGLPVVVRLAGSLLLSS
jgi:hypothetical protein